MKFPRRTTTLISTRDERGQTMTEFALVLPLLALLLFAVVQFGIAFNNYLTVTDAARAAARKGATALHSGNSTGVAAATSGAKASAGSLDTSKMGVSVTASPSWTKGSDITVTVTYPYAIALLGIVVQSGTLSSSTTERIE